MTVVIRTVSPAEVVHLLPRLIDVLVETANSGTPLGFLVPATRADVRNYWLGLLPELESKARLLVAAYEGGRIVGSGQLLFPSAPAGRHRAELQKLFVAEPQRGQGVGQGLVEALHDAALRRGRSLISLNVRRGAVAEGFFRVQGYTEAGTIPGYSMDASGEPHSAVIFYRHVSAEGEERLPEMSVA